MTSYAARRVRNLTLLVLGSLALSVWYAGYRLTLGDSRIPTGWLLLVAVLFLTLYNARKKLPFLPLARSSTWLQLHAYVGLFSLLLFLFHIGIRMPSGVFESILAAVYLIVAASGVVGLYLSRTIPPRLARRGEEVIFERIPGFLSRVRQEAEVLVLRSVEETRSSAIADFYDIRLRPFFTGPMNFVSHLRGSPVPLRGLETAMKEMSHYLGKDERKFLDTIGEIVRVKDDLDFHHANQAVLKYWLFLHIPVTYTLLLLIVLHVILVYAYGAVQ